MNRDGNWKAKAAKAQANRRVRQQIQRDKARRRRIDAVGAELSKMKI